MLTFAFLLLTLGPAHPPAPNLEIYFVDVEGGAATLIVTPSGESLLVDTGWPRPDARDAKRIVAAMQQAGVSRIDHLLITHYHMDHWGGVAELSKLVPIGTFYDHGRATSMPSEEDRNFPAYNAAYSAANHDQSHTLKPGDTIPLKGTQIRVLSAAGETGTAIGSGNPACREAKMSDADPTDNARSVGFVLTFGKFRFLDLGDLTWNVEHNLVCPNNTIGTVDLFQVSHHGMDISNSPALLATIKPRVAIMDNGPIKGGSAATYARLKAQPGLQAIYQLHRNLATRDVDNTTPELTANFDKESDCKGNWIKVSVAPGGGSYKVTNGRTGQSWDYSSK